MKTQWNASYVFDHSEFHTIRWFHKDDVPFDCTDPRLHRFLRKLYPRKTVLLILGRHNANGKEPKYQSAHIGNFRLARCRMHSHQSDFIKKRNDGAG